MKSRRRKSVNIPVVLVVALLSTAAVVLFLLFRTPEPEPLPQQLPEPEEPFDEVAYYNEEADGYIRTLPADKTVVARRIDSDNHRIYYIERSQFPSCYIYDLDTRTTSVLFGGPEGFDCDGHLVSVSAIHDWIQVGTRIFFVAQNGAFGGDYTTSTLVFGIETEGNFFSYVDFGSDAYFNDSTHVTVIKAKLQYRSFFTQEDIYSKVPVVYSLD